MQEVKGGVGQRRSTSGPRWENSPLPNGENEEVGVGRIQRKQKGKRHILEQSQVDERENKEVGEGRWGRGRTWGFRWRLKGERDWGRDQGLIQALSPHTSRLGWAAPTPAMNLAPHLALDSASSSYLRPNVSHNSTPILISILISSLSLK